MIHDILQKKIDESKEILTLAAAMSKEYYHKPIHLCDAIIEGSDSK